MKEAALGRRLRNEPIDAPAAADTRFDANAAPARPLPVTCLLVDDVDDNLLALSMVMRSDQVEVLTARSGVEALDLLLRHDVALALVDVQMPNMDGFELAELMRGSERTRHVPIIFLTAGNRDSHRLFKGYGAGAVDFLYKPVDPDILRSKAEIFFQLHRQKRQLAQELTERTETLRLNEMFVAVLGHDLRNPLSSIIAGCDLMGRWTEEESVKELAGRCLEAGTRMSRMIDALLDLTRARLGGGIPLEREPADLGALFDRLLDEYSTALGKRHFACRRVGRLDGFWDSDRLVQAMSNLVGNALQHGDADGAIDVLLDGSDDDAVTVDVTNDGLIGDDAVPHLFNPFRGGQRKSGSTAGLGLGLYIVQQIALAHGGNASMRRDDGRTTFSIRLPRGVDAFEAGPRGLEVEP